MKFALYGKSPTQENFTYRLISTGIHGPPIRSEFLKHDTRTAESVRIFKMDAGIQGPLNRSEFLKGDTGREILSTGQK